MPACGCRCRYPPAIRRPPCPPAAPRTLNPCACHASRATFIENDLPVPAVADDHGQAARLENVPDGVLLSCMATPSRAFRKMHSLRCAFLESRSSGTTAAPCGGLAKPPRPFPGRKRFGMRRASRSRIHRRYDSSARDFTGRRYDREHGHGSASGLAYPRRQRLYRGGQWGHSAPFFCGSDSVVWQHTWAGKSLPVSLLLRDKTGNLSRDSLTVTRRDRVAPPVITGAISEPTLRIRHCGLQPLRPTPKFVTH